MINRTLDDYYYREATGGIVHIHRARQPKNYDSKDPRCLIRYDFTANKPYTRIRRNRSMHLIYSDDQWFWSNYKKISKLKAKLLW